MIFANEDATLYICRYLHPNDITALARTDRDIRATMMPHMRYRTTGAEIAVGDYSVIRMDKIFTRFDRSELSYAISTEGGIVKPECIPHDYTGMISVASCGDLSSKFLWANAGVVQSVIGWHTGMAGTYIIKINPLHFSDYFRDVRNVKHMCYLSNNFMDRYMRSMSKSRDDFIVSDEFKNLVRGLDTL